MNKIKNTQNIGLIVMKPDAYCRCELGGDFYKNSLEITFVPDESYPDYTEVQDWIMKNIDGTTMNIEDVVDTVYKFLMETYRPLDLEITNNVTGCRTHFDVTVIK